MKAPILQKCQSIIVGHVSDRTLHRGVRLGFIAVSRLLRLEFELQN
ncbi:hypothetical protein MtrunA17_Chr4g0011371 [Medicago truncatula]|uniref:Uncharacterized protein n=1 Tax=Medicago truncatula TaxID=3880 RepID=A0A396I6H4_MEDTR|nr:hypothetical protein MtrunA17_Chr4g0011371 [Medicago truncatula]